MGAQISAVKQPYAYFNKELGQQIDASDVECSTIFSPVIQSKQLPWHLPVNRAPSSTTRLPVFSREATSWEGSDPTPQDIAKSPLPKANLHKQKLMWISTSSQG